MALNRSREWTRKSIEEIMRGVILREGGGGDDATIAKNIYNTMIKLNENSAENTPLSILNLYNQHIYTFPFAIKRPNESSFVTNSLHTRPLYGAFFCGDEAIKGRFAGYVEGQSTYYLKYRNLYFELYLADAYGTPQSIVNQFPEGTEIILMSKVMPYLPLQIPNSDLKNQDFNMESLFLNTLRQDVHFGINVNRYLTSDDNSLDIEVTPISDDLPVFGLNQNIDAPENNYTKMTCYYKIKIIRNEIANMYNTLDFNPNLPLAGQYPYFFSFQCLY